MASDRKNKKKLYEQHRPWAIHNRIVQQKGHSILRDAVLGAIDGCVTTFAVVAGAHGAGFPAVVTVVLGFSNLLSDGFSMAISNYQSTKAENDEVDKARTEEQRHIQSIPGGEREEVRQIYEAKGFKGPMLDTIVRVITANPRLWEDTMLIEELGIIPRKRKPMRAALATFCAFIFIGIIPLIPFITLGIADDVTFMYSIVFTAAAFFSIGLLRGTMLDKPSIVTGLETLFTGGGAAAVAYIVAWGIRNAYGNTF